MKTLPQPGYMERKPFVKLTFTNGPPARCDMGLAAGSIQYSTNPPQ